MKVVACHYHLCCSDVLFCSSCFSFTPLATEKDAQLSKCFAFFFFVSLQNVISEFLKMLLWENRDRPFCSFPWTAGFDLESFPWMTFLPGWSYLTSTETSETFVTFSRLVSVSLFLVCTWIWDMSCCFLDLLSYFIASVRLYFTDFLILQVSILFNPGQWKWTQLSRKM